MSTRVTVRTRVASEFAIGIRSGYDPVTGGDAC